MTLNKVTIFLILIAGIILTAVTQLLQINLLYSGTLLTTLTMLFIPGSLLLLTLQVTQLSFWRTLIMSVGLSITILEFVGLLMNLLLPQLGISQPLAYYPTLISFGIILSILTISAWIRTDTSLQLTLPIGSMTKKQILLYVVPLFFPVLSIFGAISINNNGSNILTFLLLGLIGLFVLLLTYGRNTFPKSLFPFSLYMIGLSLLFTTSLRGWFITGHDVMREYHVFLLTKSHYFWNINLYKDAYNACLSITILPTLLNNLLFISDMYIYKVIFQLIFALCPVLIYLILKRYTNSLFAFLSSFYFMAFPTFYNDMPMLNRQEIGFLFFGLLLLMVFDTKLPQALRKILFVIFGISIIVSHYSTNYVVLSLLIATYGLWKILSLPRIRRLVVNITKRLPVNHHAITTGTIHLSGILILVLCVFTVFWNTQFTKTSNNITGVLAKSISSIFIKSENDAKSSDVAYSLFSSKKQNPEAQLNQYIADSIQKTLQNGGGSFYNRSDYVNYPTHLIDQTILSATPVGTILLNNHMPVLMIQSLLRSISADAMQLLVGIGLVSFIIYKSRKPFDIAYILLCVSGIVLLFMEVVLPDISVEYGLLRLFDQLLYLLSLAIVMATNSIFFFINKAKRPYFVSGFAVLFFFLLTGFMSHITGDYYPQMTLDNAGIYYDAYYVHATDIASIKWIKENKVRNVPIQADLKGALTLQSFKNIFALNEIFPPIIRKNAYVYTVSANKKNNAIVSIDKNILIFNGPQAFLTDHKNLIYNNGSTEIFK